MPTVSIFALSNLSAPDFNDRMEDANNNSAYVPLRGHLDTDNFDVGTAAADDAFAYTKLRRGELTKVWTAGGTANLDYRLYWYEDQDATEWGDAAEADPGPKALDIPGGGCSFYLPEAGHVMLDWNIMWANDAISNEGASWCLLRVDGSTIDGQRRKVGKSVKGSTSGGGTTEFLGYGEHAGFAKNRIWSGHYFIGLGKGWHHASLCMAGGNAALNTRVWVRSMRAVWMGPT